jgi:hypothetical protein
MHQAIQGDEGANGSCRAETLQTVEDNLGQPRELRQLGLVRSGEKHQSKVKKEVKIADPDWETVRMELGGDRGRGPDATSTHGELD